MKVYIRNIFFIIITLIFSGCFAPPKLNVVYEKINKKNFDSYVNNLEDKIKKCYERKKDVFYMMDSYIVREDYFNPRYTKLKVFYKALPNTLWVNPNVIYIFNEGNKNRVIVRDTEIDSSAIKKLKPFIENNMECPYE